MDNGKPNRACRPHRISESSKVDFFNYFYFILFIYFHRNCRAGEQPSDSSLNICWPAYSFILHQPHVLHPNMLCLLCGRCSAQWAKLRRSCTALMNRGSTATSVTWCWSLMSSRSLLTELSWPSPVPTSMPCSPSA